MDEISALLEEHKKHNSKLDIVIDCPFCAREREEPLIARYGLGSSSLIIQTASLEGTTNE